MFSYLRVKEALTLCLVLFLLSVTNTAFSAAILQHGDTALGIDDLGNLNVWGDGPDGTAGYGVWRIGLGDATYPGCLCEGWGVAVTTVEGRTSGFANNAIGTGGLLLDSFTTDSVSATSSVSLTGADVGVSHVFGGSIADDVFQVQVTVTNNSNESMSDLVYRRVMDWDVPPTEFREYVTHQGVEANLETNGGNVRFASNNGFASANPLLAAGSRDASTINTDFVDNGAADHGSVFDFAFGDLSAGESRVFNIYYGSAADEAGALSAIDLLGADVYSLGQSSGAGGPDEGIPATFLFAFGGVGGVELGQTQSNPILPFVNEFDDFVFPEPTPRRWFDPPFVEGFTYVLEGGATFTEVGAPVGFGTLTILDDMGNVIGTVDGGDFFDLSGLGLSEFSLVGIDPLLDADDPGFSSAFPTFLDWTGTATTMTMIAIETTASAVSEPGILALFGFGVLALAFRRRSIA